MLKQKLVVLDPGHGGWDTGIQTGLISEKEINLSVCMHLRDELVAAGVQVELTREEDGEVTSSKRAELGNRHDVDLFVSWHCDSLSDRTVSGVSLWVAENSLDVVRMMAEFEWIGETICAASKQILLGVFQDHEKVLQGLTRPAVVIKGAFLSNERERQRCLQAEFLKDQAAGAAKGILQVLNAL
ncbi:MAG: N-acetylmuramoyl-L-alanine amidase family protein [Tumebacillaceae bacterium]